MNKIANAIRNRLSLRPPQEESLNILADLADKLTLKKNADLATELEKVKSSYPICAEFERTFPSLCFALATGVGKTRLMGAFISYLYLEKGIKNFFVLAPNLTIYNKLIQDFSDISHPKYVFKGIGEFVHNQPRVVTGDNYNEVHGQELFESQIHINIFNISKINAETRGGNVSRIKRMSECLGEPYFNYLSNLDDLVLLMDESHHYRADRGMEVINELNPILGLELTATPQIEKAGGPIKFKNVVYEYSLAKAIRDGFVKEPAVATRKDFIPSQYKADELDRIKLEDGIRIHEDTKVALDIFARDNKTNVVKPFVLVVAQNIEHAAQLKGLIVSQSFFEGYYADKVMEINSSQTGGEKDQNIADLVSLENPLNKIEIVIHVNMLKEGWDVTNLYTIIPLRTAASMTLREQTIGRGLRLPYGRRTGVGKVDRLTIVAHDRFQEIIDEANKPDSIIKKENVIVIDPEELKQKQVVVTAVSKIQEKFTEEQKTVEKIASPEDKHTAQLSLDARQAIVSTLPEMANIVSNINDLTNGEIKKIAIEKLKAKIYGDPQRTLFAADVIKEAEEAYDVMVKEFTANIISIPRITIQPSEQIKSGFKDFDLDVKNLNYQPVSKEILIKMLREQENSMDVVMGGGSIVLDSPERLIVNELVNYSEVDYDMQSHLLFKLATQAVTKFKSYLKEEDLLNVVQYHKREIGKFIYSQMMDGSFYCEAPTFETPIVKSFTRIEDHNFSRYPKDSIHHYTETISPTNLIPQKVFSGFKKTWHSLYKFCNKTEKDFGIILEQDNAVLKWLRPSINQFQIYWKHNSRQYHPDFVAETNDAIYLIETKKEGDIESSEVQDKARAALQYCKYATEFNLKNGGKSWKYILIPHNAVMSNMGFDTLMSQFEFRL